ncbi:PREDICTED: uncharacterized protein LOC104753394 [Camelina sativa]|uniref:Uncharacterized protein LOC104753394 n=1 Tax=Camelina sativa TaxID=90675 RepID=A0ABM0WP31_CAMSA|nr:PREDICTED: uncharacterized protein LOC104753394 [Camelina sativa]
MTISGPLKALGDGPEIISLLASVWKVWALSQVPVGSHSFPVESVYANMDHFLDPTSPGSHVSAFPWILWYLWKARNAKVFENIMERPEEVVRVAEGEALSWQQAQEEGEAVVSTVQPTVADSRLRGPNTYLPMFFSGYRCFVDGSWKSGDLFAGAGWFCTQSQDPTPSMGATNFRRSLTPLHAEVEAFIWAMRCMIRHDYRDVAFYPDCADLVKMVSSPHDWSAFSTYLDDIKMDREEFSSFSLSFIPRNANIKADLLARCARTSPHNVLYVNNFPSHLLI